ncbi:MAG: hypothetical protein ACI4R8_03600 [Candidatus Caccovivens sp.]
MCIIAVKPKGVETPSKEILNNMYRANPDGAGVAFNKNGMLFIVKGLMTFNEFWKICQEIPKESAAIYHARIQTSGGVCKELTHPFLLNEDIEEQRKTFIKTTRGEAVAHNGIFSEFTYKPLNNDTTQFISNYLSPLKKMKDTTFDSILDDDLDAIINKLCGSTNKLAIIDQNGDIKRYGGSWILSDGVYYSNNTYKRERYVYHSIFDRDFYDSLTYPSWSDKSTKSKAKMNIREQINYLRATDKDFDALYPRWHSLMSDEELLECYENGWI